MADHRQLVTESLPLSVLGGALGILFAWSGLKLFIAAAPPGFPRLSELSLDLTVLGFTAATAVLTALVFGIVPAIQASKADLAGSLKESGRSGTDGAARQHLRSALVTLQIAMALVLLIGAGLMINSFLRIERNPLGADPKNLLALDFRFAPDEAIKPYARYRNQGLWEVNPKTTQTFQRVFERLKTLPGAASVAGASTPPLAGSLRMGFWIEGRSETAGPDGMAPQSAGYIAVTRNYFSTLKATVVQDPDRPAADMRSVEEYLDRQVQFVHLYVLLLGIFGTIAAVLAAIGIYGVMAFAVAERTREIGIRMALGARANDVFRLVVLHAFVLLAVGLTLGLAGSFALTRFLTSALYEVKATDPATFATVSLLLALVALAAYLIPTRRAVSVNPSIALRYE
jgi:FtsX-like permease family protein